MELTLGGYFHANIMVVDEFNTDFWRYHIPQARQGLAAIWHASNALAGSKWARNSNHRVARVSVIRGGGDVKKASTFTFLTVGGMLHGRPGKTIKTSAWLFS